jgi:outer membrane biosynthesis protein TonB
VKRGTILIFAAAIAAFGARAENVQQPPAPAPAAAPPAPAAEAPAALSQSKFLGLLYSEIARHTPPENKAGAGDVAASFHVNAQGKIDKVVIEKTTSAAHAEIVKKILASVQAPPPPGGSFDVSQNFKFH